MSTLQKSDMIAILAYKCKIRINCKLWNTLIVCRSTELSQKWHVRITKWTFKNATGSGLLFYDSVCRLLKWHYRITKWTIKNVIGLGLLFLWYCMFMVVKKKRLYERDGLSQYFNILHRNFVIYTLAVTLFWSKFRIIIGYVSSFWMFTVCLM